MKRRISSIAILLMFCAAPIAAAKTVKPAPWKPAAPEGYTQITWASAPGVATFYKAPSGNGLMDFVTRVYLPQNEISPVISGAPSEKEPADSNFMPDYPAEVPDPSVPQDSIANYSFTRMVAETAKQVSPGVKFLWDAPFFNMGNGMSDLSLAFKYSSGGKSIVTSGTRSDADLAHERRMLLVDNKNGTAKIVPFDSLGFLDKSNDFALEGFSPAVGKSDGTTATGRLFIGVSNDGKELVVYCSRQATVNEASAALENAGIASKNQLQADGGGSTACGYNLPGQFFVEPSRTLPLMLGASTVVARGTITTQDTNVRSGPSIKDKIVTKLAKGAKVAAYEEKSGWLRIGEGQWVKKTLIKTVDIGK